MNFEMVRNANVEIEATRGQNNYPVAVATINDQFQHRFPTTSRVSKALETMSPSDLSERLTGGQFFFFGDHLIDFRDGHYNGFVHSDDSIGRLIDVIGYTAKDSKEKDNTASGSISLSTVWSDNEIEVPLYQTGGEFRSILKFMWNPFARDVSSSFELERLICANGMTGLTSFLNTKIPLINRWEEHLDIASRQIQNKVSGKVVARLGEMGDERATVSECQAVVEHADKRLQNGNLYEMARDRLKNIGRIASPILHLGKVYKENVFSDRNLGAQMPAHLTTFDLYNMITEMNTHTEETEGSSAHALDVMANGVVFSRQDLSNHASRFGQPSVSSFSDPEAAFFGTMQ